MSISPLRVAVEIHGHTINVGTAYFTQRRGNLTTSFRYDLDYLNSPKAYALDPSLPLHEGQHHVTGLPGAFADCAPDRWGRNLIKRRLRTASNEHITQQVLNDVDYLLGVSDFTRSGALRFRATDSSPFLDPDNEVPKLVELPTLLHAADHLARNDDDFATIKMLLAAGTGTLGGARPKASIRDDQGHLYIAKLPHHSDEWDIMRWEKTVLDLAERAGILTPARRIVTVDDRAVLLLKRFDRDENGPRIAYISAMTMTQSVDGELYDYVDLAETLTEHADNVGETLTELWRRIAFSIAIHNTDDHLRNIGFLRASSGWQLSPLFDVNPNPDLAEERVTSIGGATSLADEFEALMAHADVFALTQHDAHNVAAEVFEAVSDWDNVAARNGIGLEERQRLRPAFSGQIRRVS